MRCLQSCAVKRHTLTSMALVTLTEHPLRMPKVKIIFSKNSVVTNPVVSLTKKAPKKFNVSHPERVSTCHRYGIKGHIRSHCNKLRSLPNQTQWKKQKVVSPIKTKAIWVKKEDISSVLAHTMLKYLNP